MVLEWTPEEASLLQDRPMEAEKDNFRAGDPQ